MKEKNLDLLVEITERFIDDYIGGLENQYSDSPKEYLEQQADGISSDSLTFMIYEELNSKDHVTLPNSGIEIDVRQIKLEYALDILSVIEFAVLNNFSKKGCSLPNLVGILDFVSKKRSK